MDTAPLPPEIIETLARALNPTEAARLLSIYRRLGVHAAVKTGLWLNKNRSAEGMAAWRVFNGPAARAKRQRKKTNRDARRTKADAILQSAIAAAQQP